MGQFGLGFLMPNPPPPQFARVTVTKAAGTFPGSANYTYSGNTYTSYGTSGGSAGTYTVAEPSTYGTTPATGATSTYTETVLGITTSGTTVVTLLDTTSPGQTTVTVPPPTTLTYSATSYQTEPPPPLTYTFTFSVTFDPPPSVITIYRTYTEEVTTWEGYTETLGWRHAAVHRNSRPAARSRRRFVDLGV